jgi:hypothetical protein
VGAIVLAFFWFSPFAGTLVTPQMQLSAFREGNSLSVPPKYSQMRDFVQPTRSDLSSLRLFLIFCAKWGGKTKMSRPCLQRTLEPFVRREEIVLSRGA